MQSAACRHRRTTTVRLAARYALPRPPLTPRLCACTVLTFSKGSTQRNVFHYTTYSLAALVPAGVFMGGGLASAADMVLAVVIPLHFHIGLRSVILDYVKPDSVQRTALIASTAFAALATVGFITFNVRDVGMIEGTKMLWRAPKKDAKAEE